MFVKQRTNSDVSIIMKGMKKKERSQNERERERWGKRTTTRVVSPAHNTEIFQHGQFLFAHYAMHPWRVLVRRGVGKKVLGTRQL